MSGIAHARPEPTPPPTGAVQRSLNIGRPSARGAGRESIIASASGEWRSDTRVQELCEMGTHVNRALRDSGESALTEHEMVSAQDSSSVARRDVLIADAVSEFDGSGLRQGGFDLVAFVDDALLESGLSPPRSKGSQPRWSKRTPARDSSSPPSRAWSRRWSTSPAESWTPANRCASIRSEGTGRERDRRHSDANRVGPATGLDHRGPCGAVCLAHADIAFGGLARCWTGIRGRPGPRGLCSTAGGNAWDRERPGTARPGRCRERRLGRCRVAAQVDRPGSTGCRRSGVRCRGGSARLALGATGWFAPRRAAVPKPPCTTSRNAPPSATKPPRPCESRRPAKCDRISSSLSRDSSTRIGPLTSRWTPMTSACCGPTASRRCSRGSRRR